MTPPDPSELPPRLWFRMQGNPEQEGYVDARNFVQFLEGVLKVLRSLERNTTAGVPVTYRIIDLGIGSAVVELEAESTDEMNYAASQIVDRFEAGVAALRSGTLETQNFDRDAIRQFKSLLQPLGPSLPAVTVKVKDTEVVLGVPEQDAFSLESQIASMANGSFSGFIDAINVHTEPIFFLYPPAGPARIACEFDRTRLDEVRAALKQYVTVFGLLAYQSGSAFPKRIIVERIEVNPSPELLPTLASLRGIAPDLTGGLDSVAFVRRLRDAEA